MVQQTHLHQYHVKHARMIEFAGFEMPLWYNSISEEHIAVRNHVGLFDVSHMGRFSITGPEATRLLDYILPSDVSKVPSEKAFYSVICNEQGGIVDDTVILKFSDQAYILVANAANRKKDFLWISKYAEAFDVKLDDISSKMGMLALQGPKALEVIQQLVNIELSRIRRFYHSQVTIGGINAVLSRTGYTGEDGFEIFVPDCSVDEPFKLLNLWKKLLAVGTNLGLLPCGLGARDTLRLEAGLPLYGLDIDDETSPIEAGLKWVVAPEKSSYIGSEALSNQLRKGVRRIRTGFIAVSGGVPRAGYIVQKGGERIGTITSGTFSPLLRRGIALGYVAKEHDIVGSSVEILTKSRSSQASIVHPPFYDTFRYGWKRGVNWRKG